MTKTKWAYLVSAITFIYVAICVMPGANGQPSRKVKTYLKADTITCDQIRLTWPDTLKNVMKFVLERDVTGKERYYDTLVVLDYTYHEWLDSDLEPSHTYNYRIIVPYETGVVDTSKMISPTTLQPSQDTTCYQSYLMNESERRKLAGAGAETRMEQEDKERAEAQAAAERQRREQLQLEKQQGTGEEAAQEPKATITNSWIEFNVFVNGQKGIKIHANFTVNNCLNIPIHTAVFFYNNDNYAVKAALDSYSNSDGNLTVEKKITPVYKAANYSDYWLFLPYKALPKGIINGYCYFLVILNNKEIGGTGNLYFNITSH